MDRLTTRQERRSRILIEAAPIPIVAAVVAQMGLEAAPAGPRALAVAAPPEAVPHLAAALVSAGACVYRIAPQPHVRPHRRAAPRSPRLGHPQSHHAAPPQAQGRGIMTPFTEVIVGNRWLQRFATIRWKLTGAFLAVSLLLALTMIAVFVAGLIYILNAPLLPQAVAESARDVSRTVGAELADPSGNPERVFEILNRFANPPQQDLEVDVSSGLPPADGPPSPSPAAADELLVVLLNTQGSVITSTSPLAYPAGLALTAAEPAPAGELLVRALRGITDTAELSAWSRGDHQPMGVAPIFGPDGQVTGVVYMRLADFPEVGVLLGNLTPFVVSFIVPWLLVSGGFGML
jgi:hypothetical protein